MGSGRKIDTVGQRQRLLGKGRNHLRVMARGEGRGGRTRDRNGTRNGVVHARRVVRGTLGPTFWYDTDPVTHRPDRITLHPTLLAVAAHLLGARPGLLHHPLKMEIARRQTAGLIVARRRAAT